MTPSSAKSRKPVGSAYKRLWAREGARNLDLITPEGVRLDFDIASVGDRIAAFFVDLMLMILMILLFALLAFLSGGLTDWGRGWILPATILVLFLLRNFYFAFFEIRWQGLTPGKRRVGIQVIDSRGGQLSGEAVFVRNLTRDLETFWPLTILFAPWLAFPDAQGWAMLLTSGWLLVFALIPLLNRNRLRIGDMIAGTVVVRRPNVLLLEDLASTVKTASTEQRHFTFTPEQLEAYGIFELQVLEDLLRKPKDVNTINARLAVARKIKAKIGWQEPPREQDRHTDRFLQEYYRALRAHLEKEILYGRRKEDKHSGN